MEAARLWGGPTLRTVRSILPIVCLCLLSGCHSRPQARFTTAEAALSRLQAQSDCSRAMTGDADLVVSGAFFEIRGKLLYLAQAPDRLRFDLYSTFGVTLSTLTSDGEKFGLYSLDEKSFWYGPAKTCNIQRFTQVPVPSSALVELLRGRAPVLVHSARNAEIRYASPLFERGYYVIDITSKHQATQRIQFEVVPEDMQKPLQQQRLRLISVHVKQENQLLYIAKLDEHQSARVVMHEPNAAEVAMGLPALPPSGPQCSAELPGRIEFKVPDVGYSLMIENHETSHNPPLASSAFTQKIPGGVRSGFSDCSE